MAADGIQYAGEFTISDAKIFSSSGNVIPLEGLVQTITIFESMYKQSMTGVISILDTNSIVKNLPIIGQEFLSFKIKTSPEGKNLSYNHQLIILLCFSVKWSFIKLLIALKKGSSYSVKSIA